ncbi:C39 family peptidase [Bacillus sp. FJAT-27445]|uniref:C39 family peptidase n=1 Tax=Bacillus sp. FJAT-27445 TaxID=1679166 RepID=UPI000743887D|nr:C39 family peptidase [Bacillus sp. FJAT-27445]
MKFIQLLAAALLLQGCSLGNEIVEGHSKPVHEKRSPVAADNENKESVHDNLHPPEIFQLGTASELPKKMMLDVPLIKQNPELKYGCEVTSLAMVLNYAGIKVDKMELSRAIRKDPDPLFKAGGKIIKWGDPSKGFVGDMTGKEPGYAVFDKPIVNLMNTYLPGRAVNLTNQEFSEVLAHIASGFPAVIWTTGDFRLPDRWESWLHGKRSITTPLDLHAVVLVGFDSNKVYVNDPLSEKKQLGIDREQFTASWKALKSRAVSYK